MSAHGTSSSDVAVPHDHAAGTGRIWKIFWLLSVITIIELIMGFGLAKHWYGHPDENATKILIVKGVICVLSLAKAFYIVSVFMHLGDEIRNLIMTIVVPLCLFIWFITAFLWDGNSWRDLKNTDGHSKPAKTEQHEPAIEKGHQP
jgi:hypothetical protein